MNVAVRAVAVLALLVAIAFGYQLALLALLAWQAVQLANLQRELFNRQEEAVLRRLRDYWYRLTDKEQPPSG